MKIISLKDRRKGLTSVLLEDGTELLLDTEIVIIKNLTPGAVIGDPDALLYESDLKRAKSRALWYLSRGDLSEKKLTEKLTLGGFMPSAVQSAAERMKELGLVDDLRLAQRLFEYYSEGGSSKREIYFKLTNKGIPSGIAKQVLEENETDEQEKLIKLIKTKYASKLKTEEGVQKTFAALVRKGFSFSDVKEALKAYSEELEEVDEF
ncbi:MAG: regulatory protein RecX [Clostridia bacterium]|nr:regulatory protein RecX [Clostridia bacterium]